MQADDIRVETERERQERLKQMCRPVGMSVPKQAQMDVRFQPCSEHEIPYDPNSWTCRTCTDRHRRGACTYPPGQPHGRNASKGINTTKPITIPTLDGSHIYMHTHIGESMNGTNNAGTNGDANAAMCLALGITPEQLAKMQVMNAQPPQAPVAPTPEQLAILGIAPAPVPAPAPAQAPVQWAGPFENADENVHFQNVVRALKGQPGAKRAELAALLGWPDDTLRSWMSNPKVVSDERFATTDDGKARPALKWLRQFVEAETVVAAPVPEPVPAPAPVAPPPQFVAPAPGQTQTVPAGPAIVPQAPTPAPAGPTVEQLAQARAMLESAGQQVVPQGQYATPAPAAPAKASPQDVAFAMRAADGLKAIGQVLIDCGYADPDWKRVKGWMEVEPERIEQWVAKQGYDVQEYKARAQQ